MSLDNNRTTPPSEDTTSAATSTNEQASTALGHAERLLASVETLQNTLAHAQRRSEGGQEVDFAQVLERTQATLREVERQVRDFPGSQARPQMTSMSALSLVDGYWEYIRQRREAAGTGFGRLNQALGGGLEPQRLVVLLGAPGSGKTTFANQIAVHASEGGRPVMYVTCEDVPYTLLSKTIARLGGIAYTAVLKGYESERERIMEAMERYRSSSSAERLHYLDATRVVDLDAVREQARAHFQRFAEGGQGILVVDYLQRLARAQGSYRNGNMDLRQAVTVLTEQLRAIAVELDCCVVALASMNRASGYGAMSSTLATAKESGDIEYTADVILGIGDDDRPPTATWLKSKVLRIDKNRQGDNDIMIQLDWYPAQQQFTEVSADLASVGASSNGLNGGRRGGRS